MKWITAFIALCLLVLIPARASAVPVDGNQLHIFLITLGPGADPWEKFGHDFIDVEDPLRQIIDPVDDAGKQLPPMVSYNWGVFDFGSGISGISSFGWHFLQGKLVYSMRARLTQGVIDEYKNQGRYILKQELDLTARQKVDLVARLIDNDTDAKRFYLYDYFVKNCSTMTRDAIDQTVDGHVHNALAKIPTSTTYRWHDRRCTADDVWLYVFLDIALGHGVDQALSAWEESFLPMKLSEHLRQVMVPDEHGKLVPLILSEQVVNIGTFPQRDVPPKIYFYGFLVTGIAFGGVLGAMAFYGIRSRAARRTFKFFAVIWSLLAGILGLLLSLAWLTDHAAAKWNENWFVFNFLSLGLVILIPTIRKWPNAARKLALIVLGLSVFNLFMKVTPWFYQGNASLLAVAIPIHTAIAWGLFRLTQAKTPPVDPAAQTSNAEALRAA